MASRWRPETAREINLAPLLDVIFCLLFFFILATSLRRNPDALEVSLPRSNQGAPERQKTEPLVISIGADNRIVFEGKRVSSRDLEQALRRAKSEAVRPVMIRSDGKADVQVFMDVSDACAAAGLESVRMETRPRGAAGASDTRSEAPPRRRRNQEEKE